MFPSTLSASFFSSRPLYDYAEVSLFTNIIILYSNTVYSIQMVFEKEDHEVIPI